MENELSSSLAQSILIRKKLDYWFMRYLHSPVNDQFFTFSKWLVETIAITIIAITTGFFTPLLLKLQNDESQYLEQLKQI